MVQIRRIAYRMVPLHRPFTVHASVQHCCSLAKTLDCGPPYELSKLTLTYVQSRWIGQTTSSNRSFSEIEICAGLPVGSVVSFLSRLVARGQHKTTIQSPSILSLQLDILARFDSSPAPYTFHVATLFSRLLLASDDISRSSLSDDGTA
jgi:hypothetical protein